MSDAVYHLDTIDTRFPEQSFSMEWQISNFGMIPFDDVPSLKSPTFKLGDESNKSWWQLKMYKRVRADEDALGFRLHREEGLDFKWNWAKLSIDVEANGMRQTFFTDVMVTFEEPIENSVLYKLKSDFDVEKVGILYAIDVKVICKILFTYQDDKIHRMIEDIGLSNLLHDFEVLYKHKLYSDVTVVADGIKILAHKSILIARGLKEMLITDGRVLKLDLPAPVALALLDYIYLGKMPESISDVFKLYSKIADYGLCALKHRCKYILANDALKIGITDFNDVLKLHETRTDSSDSVDEYSRSKAMPPHKKDELPQSTIDHENKDKHLWRPISFNNETEQRTLNPVNVNHYPHRAISSNNKDEPQLKAFSLVNENEYPWRPISSQNENEPQPGAQCQLRPVNENEYPQRAIRPVNENEYPQRAIRPVSENEYPQRALSPDNRDEYEQRNYSPKAQRTIKAIRLFIEKMEREFFESEALSPNQENESPETRAFSPIQENESCRTRAFSPNQENVPPGGNTISPGYENESRAIKNSWLNDDCRSPRCKIQKLE